MSLLDTVKQAGIVGAGGAGFPTHVKLNAKAEWFIVNAAECEPLIETDKFLCRTQAPKIIAAAQAVAAHLGAAHTVIALKEKYLPEIAALEEAIAAAGAKIEICRMGVFYPAGDEQTMVQYVTGRSVPERGLPLDVGAVVDNVGTLVNLYDAMTDGTPVIDKYLSVVGEVEEPVMLHVPVGTPVEACIRAAKPKISDYIVVTGGPMMGKLLAEPGQIRDAVVTKTTGNLLILPRGHALQRHAELPLESIRLRARSACIQCRMCTDLCPRYLLGHQMRPHLVMRNLWREDAIEDGEAFLQAFGDAQNCCSCGVCEMFACPMGLAPRRVNEYMKGVLRQKGLSLPKRPEPEALSVLNQRRIPTERLIARLDLSQYEGKHAHECRELHPEEVFVPFSQHIGKPAAPVKHAGERVARGELLAAAAEGGLSANIHPTSDSVITEINASGARISGRKEG